VRSGLPAVYPFREFTEAGGLISYGPNIANSYRQAGIYACVCRKRRPFDLMTESLIVGHDGRADILPLEPGYLALQAQEPT